MSRELKHYIEQALHHGRSKPEIRESLIASGWSLRIIDQILSQYIGVDGDNLPIPAPRMQSHQIARDLFLYLLALVTLGMSAFAVGSLLFSHIDHLFPSYQTIPSYDYHTTDGSISWAIAQIVVAFPVYTWVSFVIAKDIAANPEKRESLIRKLMVYLILVISAFTTLGDLVATLYSFLQGDFTIRFLAKAGVILTISLLIFLYYLYEVRRDDALVQERTVA